ncbi:MAG: cbb3-type cytochrome oxidase assembly protein CcoS [Deltaproteobacteria bacterium CG11_big_fil_rev_8_21_14_0_20_45_16]|nr:MAG: cbb3-type cytochrome oxidase assembly protein CcoS [Deltaproteobacteria bacterium CG11_big_fil_rev_8_21_14_0_20_45_16]
MSALYITIIAALILLIIFLGLLAWAIVSGQWDDLETPAHRILLEELNENRK